MWRRAAPASDWPEIVFSTSGSTGLPKLVAHSGIGVGRHVAAVADSLGFIADRDVVGGFVPLCGVFGYVTVFAALVAGRPAVMTRRFDPDVCAEVVQRTGVTHGSGSDQLVRRLFSVDGAAQRLKSLRKWSFGTFGNDAVELVGMGDRSGVAFYNIYGSSEVLAYAARQPIGAAADLRAVPGGEFPDPTTQLRVREPGSGRILEPGQVGEMEIRGPNAMLGYLTPSGLDKSGLTDDGWVRTGDLGVRTPGGVRFVGRAAEVLRLSGFLVEPKEIEVEVEALDEVTEATAVAVEVDRTRGPRAVVFVVVRLDASESFDEARILSRLRSSLSTYKIPERVVAVAHLPRIDSPNGPRIDKRSLRETAARLLAASADRSTESTLDTSGIDDRGE